VPARHGWVRVLAWRTGQLRMHVPAMDARGNPVLDLEARNMQILVLWDYGQNFKANEGNHSTSYRR